jgi:hypothetical protein
VEKVAEKAGKKQIHHDLKVARNDRNRGFDAALKRRFTLGVTPLIPPAFADYSPRATAYN